MDQTMMSVAAEEEERISFGSTGARGEVEKTDPSFSKQKEL